MHWRSLSRDNVLTVYGKDSNARIADPVEPGRIFTWLICETRDDKGNATVYEYKPEDGTGVDRTRAHESNRGGLDDPRRRANRYLKHIRYGNRVPLLDGSGQRPLLLTPAQIENAGWMFEVVFDYGEHDAEAPKPKDPGLWTYRGDPFSSYRAGFEVRTGRLCQRVLMFHHFAGEPDVGADCLVRSTDFTYSHEQDPADARNPVYTFLRAVTQSGYRRSGGGYLKRSLPPVEFEYSQPVVQDTVEDVDPASLENLPIGLDGSAYQWTDLHGEGIPGLLAEQAGAWFYKRNVSPLSEGPVEFAPVELVAARPNLEMAGGQAQLMDLAGDGQPDLVVLDGPMPGLYEHDGGEGWEPFRPFSSRLGRDLRDPNLKLVDLDGDGHADVLISEDDAFVWHESLAEEGFGPPRRVAQALDEEKGPRLAFADRGESIHLADLSGDGLTDLVRIRNGEVCYWPNLGFGRFGAKVTMDNAPWFDHPDQFDPKRLRLADVDGTGTTDILYLHRDGVRLYFNQSGNGWSEPQILRVFPRVDDLVSITPVDLRGNGTACLVWSSPLPGDARRQMRLVDLMGGMKPHLLIRMINNLGAETRVEYASSTKFYLQDRRDGKPWITRLPFPVHVVERVETQDHISRNRFVTRYAYHHGYFDGEEREFRGFGMVERLDTEELAALASGGLLPAVTNVDPASHVPPTRARTWFHTGVYLGRDHVSDFFAGFLNAQDQGEYYREPGLTDAQARALLLPDTVLPSGLTLEEEREACRALKGLMLRQEVYALDGSPKEEHPYTVVEQSFSVRLEQPCDGNRHAIFFSHPREAITYHYERNPADPRVQHTLTLEVDSFGNVLKEAVIGYGRRQPDPSLPLEIDRDKQTQTLVTYIENRLTPSIDDGLVFPGSYRAPLPCETRTYELTGYSPSGAAGRFQSDDFVQAAGKTLTHLFDTEIDYEDLPTGDRQRRVIEQIRTLYRADDLTSLLRFGQVEPLALAGESYKLAFTPGLLAEVFQRNGQPLLPNPANVLGGQAADRGGYLSSQQLKADGRFPNTDPEDHWWIPAGQSFFTTNPGDPAATESAQARQHFFLPRRYRDPFGQEAFVDFDANDLLMVETRDALGNRVTVNANDYRVLQPRLVSDPNRNRTEVAFDALGMVVGTAVMGKPLPAPMEGDSLTGFVADLTPAELDSFFSAPDPHTSTQALLQGATTRVVYDLDRFHRTRQAHPNDPTQWQPPGVATLARETHLSVSLPPQGLRIQLNFSYSDGFGREIQKKLQAEPGAVVEGGPVVISRWVGSGWTIFNNKGKPVRQYEPFFSPTYRFELGVQAGVSPVLFYDPAERVVAKLHPNHTFEKVVFDPWRQITYDVNDTCAPRNAQTGDPRTDPDIGGYVARYFAALPASPPAPMWQTWHAQRVGGALGPHEQAAAARAAAHADTPTTTHFDVLGRTFLTVARNRVVCAGHDLDGTEDNFHTRVELDIEGNQRAVRDAREEAGDALGRIVMLYAYDLLGNRIYQLSMEAGARWMLHDVMGKPLRTWDSRGHNFVTTYDVLRRPVEQFVRGTTTDSDPRTLSRDLLVEKTEFGESLANAEALNLRTRIYQQFDCAGVATHARLDTGGTPLEAYDFKGNLLHSTRRLASDYRAIPDWLLNPQLETETFESSTRYDALNRPVQSIAPHSSLARAKRNVIQPVFNDADLLERVDVWLERAIEPTALLDPAVDAPSPVGVAGSDYNAKGQRLRIDYKNGASTFHGYDPLTFRLTHLYTRRGAAFTEDCDNPQPPPPTMAAPDIPPQGKACGLQNLRYTYDPIGNIAYIQDDAQQAIYFNNQRVEPSNDYIYDALYRLIQATGREHLGQTGGVPNPSTAPEAFNAFHTRLDHPGNGNAMGTYIERYVYDAVGNLLEMQHRGSDPAHAGWTRAFDCAETSLIEDGSGGAMLKTSNRLTRTTLNPNGANPPQVEPYQHDVHGNMVRMPHLGGGLPGPNLHWDFKDQLRRTDSGGGGTAFYVYDTSGQRVRKVWEKAPGLTEERIYLSGFEIFRRHDGAIGVDTAELERETLHVIDDKQRIALVETRTLDTSSNIPAPGPLIRLQLGNHLGSVNLELDGQAQILSYEEYAPYGSSTYQAVRSQTETPKRYRYTGTERDEETGLGYHSRRYYAYWLARWSSPDPEGLVDGPNLYRYARDNPLILIDPGGTQPVPVPDPETILVAATALQRAAAAWGTASVLSGGAAATAPVVGGATAPAVGTAAASLAAGSAAAAVAAQAAAAVAMALAVHLYMQRAGSIARYGNPYGMPARDIAFPVLREAQRLRADPYPVPEPAPAPDPERQRRPRLGRVYVTYTKYNSQTGRYYSGRTSAVIDLNLPWRLQALAAVQARDANHHVEDESPEPTAPGFGPAVLDQFTVGLAVDYGQRYRDVGYLAIRGREQQLIDYHGARRAAELGIGSFRGGAQSDTPPGTPLTENAIRGVGRDNPLGQVFHTAANLAFGELAPYTGDPIR
ncbi:MAG TPA: SpvB/TcaC N-terminal domain-containing protein [Thermoanaerobaculia bacterium]|nr:SpvB/TcaC N-terminal domain-containing protein [Thermoanaerobaculia bacterium]